MMQLFFSYNFVADSFNVLVHRLEHKSDKPKTKKGLIKGRIIMHFNKLMLIFELSINRIFQKLCKSILILSFKYYA